MSSGKQPSTTTTIQKTELPPHIQAASQANIAKANEIAARPWTGWQQPVTAGWTPEMTRAADETGARAFGYEGGIQQAQGGLSGAMGVQQGVAGAEMPNVDAFMNPRMAAIIDEINRQGSIQRNLINRSAAGRRDLGGDAHMLAQGKQLEGQTRQAGLAAAEGWDRALGAAQAQQQLQLAGAAGAGASARSLADLAGLENQLKYQDLSALMGIGEAKRGDQQAEINQAIQNFYESRDWDARNLAMQNATVSGVPYEQTQRTTSPYFPKSPLAGAFGGAMSGAGMGMSLGGPWGAAAGGILGLLAGGFS